MFLRGDIKTIEPASAAIIMALGIYLIGAIEAFPTVDQKVGQSFALLLFVAWIVVYFFLTRQFFYRSFFWSLVKHPIRAFTIGTWIAGVSVLCNALLKYFPNMAGFIRMIAVFNVFLSVFFVVVCLYQFRQLFKKKETMRVDGVILLSTVGLQSITILVNNVIGTLPILISEFVIIIGLCFYLIGIMFMVKRYRELSWTIADDWANTNCIIHGALSITGLAIVSAGAFTPLAVQTLWVIVFVLLLVIEVIELIRLKLRLKKYGMEKGIMTYHVSQWSRNFTFGMFFTFTLFMHKNPSYNLNETLFIFQQSFLVVWSWVVTIALLVQIMIFIRSQLIMKARQLEKA